MSGWETKIQTGNPQMDQMTVEQHRQAAAAQGLQLDVQPLPGGGFNVRAFAPQAAQQAQGYGGQGGYGQGAQQYGQQQHAYGQQQQHAYGAQPQAAGYGQAAFAGAGGVVVGGPQVGASGNVAVPMTADRLRHIRKVYSLLAGASFLAILCGILPMLGPTVPMWTDGHRHKVAVPVLIAAMVDNPVLLLIAFGALFVSTLIAGAVTKVKGLNLFMLFLVAGLMGFQLAPMAFVAQTYGAIGETLSLNPVRDTFLMVGAVFGGITAYTFITRKDFSYLGSILGMGTGVVFVACLLTFVFQTEIFSLAVASVGALLSAGFLLFRTSRIMTGPMDDAVGDALGMLVSLRNLFMFILRILMSSRR
jgi:modulator of FtsH protease